MDIKGAELSALRGMVELLSNQRPILAVSIYHHKPKLYVRQHGYHGFNTVLYVVL